MPVQAKIQVNGVDGSNNNLPLNTLVQLNNHGLGGETTYLWVIADQPLGVGDALSSTTIQNPTLTPKKEGSYLVTLVIDQGLATECTDSAIVGVQQVKTLLRIPAASETTEMGATGWAPDVDAALQKFDTFRSDPNTMLAVAIGNINAGQVCYLGDLTTIKTSLPGQETLPKAFPVAATADLSQMLFINEGPPTNPGGAAVAGDIIILRFGGLFRATSYAPLAGAAPAYCDGTGIVSATYAVGSRLVGTFQGNGAAVSYLIWGGTANSTGVISSDVATFTIADDYVDVGPLPTFSRVKLYNAVNSDLVLSGGVVVVNVINQTATAFRVMASAKFPGYVPYETY